MLERKSFSRFGWSLIAGFLGMFAVQLFLIEVFSLLFDGYSGWQDIVMSLCLYLGTLGMMLLILKKAPKMEVEKKPLKLIQFLGVFVVAMGGMYLFSILGSMLDSAVHILINGSDTSYNPVSNYVDSMGLLTIFMSTCVLAPIFEELIFRKVLLDRLRPFGDKVAILYSGIAFGLMHMNFQQIFFATAVGFLLGYLLVRTNNIWYCVGLHFVFNLSSAILLPLVESMTRTNAIIVIGYTILLLALSVLGLVLFFIYVGRIKLDPAPYALSRPVNIKLALFTGWAWPYVLICLAMSVWYVLAMIL